MASKKRTAEIRVAMGRQFDNFSDEVLDEVLAEAVQAEDYHEGFVLDIWFKVEGGRHTPDDCRELYWWLVKQLGGVSHADSDNLPPGYY